MGTNHTSNARDQRLVLNGTYYPRIEEQSQRLCRESAIKSPELRAAGAQSLRRMAVPQRAPLLTPLSIRPQYSLQGSQVSLLSFAIICGSLSVLLTCLMSSASPLQTVWSVKAGPSGLSRLLLLCSYSTVPGGAQEICLQLMDGRVDGWRDDEYIRAETQRGISLLREELGSALLGKSALGTPFAPSRTLVLGIWQQQEVWGCLCCLSEDVRPCGPRSIGQGGGMRQPDRISQTGWARLHVRGVSQRRTFPLGGKG